MTRKSAGQVRIKPNLRCLKVYPTTETSKSVADLKTVGIKLSRVQAIEMARVLLAVSQDWNEIDVTAYRQNSRRSDGTFQITITSFQE